MSTNIQKQVGTQMTAVSFLHVNLFCMNITIISSSLYIV